MEYFGEDPASATCLGVCCDVCMEEMELQDQQQHMAVILQAAAEIPGNGELKVHYCMEKNVVVFKLSKISRHTI